MSVPVDVIARCLNCGFKKYFYVQDSSHMPPQSRAKISLIAHHLRRHGKAMKPVYTIRSVNGKPY